MKKDSKLNKKSLKKSAEELQLYLHFKKRDFVVPAKKGKGSSYKRKSKYPTQMDQLAFFFSFLSFFVKLTKLLIKKKF